MHNPPIKEERFSTLNSDGLNVVSYQFFSNLIKYGNFDEYHFFCSAQLYPLFSNMTNEKMKFLKKEDLQSNIKNVDYYVFYNSGHDGIIPLLKLRDKYNKNFSLFSLVHSQNSFKYFRWCHEYITYSSIKDVRISSSLTGKLVLNSYFNYFQKVGDLKKKPKIKVIPFGIDLSSLKKYDKISVRNELNIPKDSKVILYLGRLCNLDKSDLIPILKLFNRLLQKNKDYFFIVSGADIICDYTTKLHEYVQTNFSFDKIKIYKNITDEFKCKLYSAADLFISFPDSIQETFGITLLEAMSYGLPIICSEWDGYKEIIEEGCNGFKIKTYWNDLNFLKQVSDEESIIKLLQQKNSVVIDLDHAYQKINFIFSNREVYNKIKQNNYEKVSKLYSWKNVIKKHLKLLESIQKLNCVNKKNEMTKNSSFVYDIYKHFKHYPSIHNLFDNPNLILYSKTNVVEVHNLISNYYLDENKIMNNILKEDLLNFLINFFKDGRKYEELTKNELEWDRNIINFNLLWLLKQDFFGKN